MIRTFITEELKRTFLPGVTMAGTLALITLLLKPLLSRLVDDKADLPTLTGLLLVFLTVFMVSAGASATFSLSFRQGPLRLLENLPIARRRIWLVRVLVSSLTTVSSLGLITVAQPAVVDHDREVLFVAMSVGLLLFSGGICWSLVVHSGTAAAMLLNLILAIPSVVFLVALIRVGLETAEFQHERFLMGAGTVSAVYFLVSFLLFMRGEFEIRRRRFFNALGVSGAIIGVFCALIAAADLGLLGYSAEWVQADSVDHRTWAHSPDGRYLALILQQGHDYATTKVVVLDVESGNTVKTIRQGAVRSLLWEKNGSLLAFSDGTIIEKFLGAGRGTVRAARVFPGEETVFKRRKSAVDASIETGETSTFLILRDSGPFQPWEGEASVIHLNAEGGPGELARYPFRLGNMYVGEDKKGFFLHVQGRTIRFLVGDKVRIMNVAWGPFLFETKTELEAMQAELRQNIPPPAAGASALPGTYIYSEDDIPHDENGWLYYLQADPARRSGRLLARRNTDKEWEEVLDNLALTEGQIKLIALFSGGYGPVKSSDLWTGFHSGLVARIYGSGTNRRILLADMNTGERFDFADTHTYQPQDGEAVSISSRAGYFVINPFRVVRGNSVFLPGFFTYRAGQGKPVASLPAPPRKNIQRPQAVAFLGPGGIRVYHSANGFTATKPGGATRQLWPQ